jgi:hypothetical protein
MQGRVLTCVVIVGLLLIGGAAVARANDSNLNTTTGSPPVILSGGSYRLTAVSWPVNGAVSGGHYQLVPSMPSVDPAAGCCCKSYLSCVTK